MALLLYCFARFSYFYHVFLSVFPVFYCSICTSVPAHVVAAVLFLLQSLLSLPASFFAPTHSFILLAFQTPCFFNFCSSFSLCLTRLLLLAELPFISYCISLELHHHFIVSSASRCSSYFPFTCRSHFLCLIVLRIHHCRFVDSTRVGSCYHKWQKI